MKRPSAKKRIEKIIKDWPIKALSLAIAMVLFMFHRLSMLEERYFIVPLVVDSHNDLVPATSYPHVVRLSLRGDPSLITTLSEDSLEAYIDIDSYTSEGIYKIPVRVRQKAQATHFESLEIQPEPAEIMIGLERSLSKLVPVTPSFRGYLETGYELASFQIEPAQVYIVGPRTKVAEITDVTTESIELTGRKENFSVTVRLQSKDSLVSIKGNTLVTFKAVVQQSLIIKNFENIPLIVTGLPSSFIARLQINYGSIKLQGAQKELEAYTPDYSILSLDCSDIKGEGTYIIPVTVQVPPNFQVIRFDPLEVPVEVVRKGRENP